MTTIRIVLDFKSPEVQDFIEKHHRDDLEDQTITDVVKKTFDEVGSSISEMGEEYRKSFAIYMVRNIFSLYEFFKNAYDANANKICIFIHIENDKIVTAVADDGDGLKHFFDKLNRKDFRDKEGAFDYGLMLKTNPDLIKSTKVTVASEEKKASQQEEIEQIKETNNPHQEKIARLKKEIQELEYKKMILEEEIQQLENQIKNPLNTKRKIMGGHGKGLKEGAKIANAVDNAKTGDAKLFLMDREDFIKSKHYQKLTGIKPEDLPNDHGALVISVSPIFSQKIVNEIKKEDATSKRGTALNKFYVFMTGDNEKIYKKKPKKSIIDFCIEQIETDSPDKPETPQTPQTIPETSTSEIPQTPITSMFFSSSSSPLSPGQSRPDTPPSEGALLGLSVTLSDTPTPQPLPSVEAPSRKLQTSLSDENFGYKKSNPSKSGVFRKSEEKETNIKLKKSQSGYPG